MCGVCHLQVDFRQRHLGMEVGICKINELFDQGSIFNCKFCNNHPFLIEIGLIGRNGVMIPWVQIGKSSILALYGLCKQQQL